MSLPDPFGDDYDASAASPLDTMYEVFRRYLGEGYDLDVIGAVVATAACERLDGDPVWLLVVGGSGNAKTETVNPVATWTGATVKSVSTLTGEAALLSATSAKERAKDATGGVLRELGETGVLVIKDVTSILSMSGDARDGVLGALREVYDGAWSRRTGTDGGKSFDWAGRIVIIGAVTTAWDTAHSVVAKMGDRFVLIRMDSTTGRLEAGRQALRNTGNEVAMRRDLGRAVAAVLDTVDPSNAITLTEDEYDILLRAANLVTTVRTAVEHDRMGNVVDAHALEMPTRFAKQLGQIVRGAVAIGMARPDALRLAIRCARDSMPPLRLALVDFLADHPDSSVGDVTKGIGKPRTTVDRQLQALHMLGVVSLAERETGTSKGSVSRWFYSLSSDIDTGALSMPTPSPDSAEHPQPPQRPEPPPLPLGAGSAESGHPGSCWKCSGSLLAAGAWCDNRAHADHGQMHDAMRLVVSEIGAVDITDQVDEGPR